MNLVQESQYAAGLTPFSPVWKPLGADGRVVPGWGKADRASLPTALFALVPPGGLASAWNLHKNKPVLGILHPVL